MFQYPAQHLAVCWLSSTTQKFFHRMIRRLGNNKEGYVVNDALRSTKETNAGCCHDDDAGKYLLNPSSSSSFSYFPLTKYSNSVAIETLPPSRGLQNTQLGRPHADEIYTLPYPTQLQIGGARVMTERNRATDNYRRRSLLSTRLREKLPYLSLVVDEGDA